MATPEENRRVNFTVKVEHANNRAFHWTLEGEGLTPDCVEGGQITGLSETVGQTVVVSILLRGDQAVKNLKNIRMIIRENGPTGNIVARSTLVTVNIIIPTKPIEPDGSNIVIVGLEHNETPDEYAMDPQAPAPENIPYFTTPEVDEWPLGMTSKNIPLALSPVGAILHMQIRPMKLGDAMYPAADFSNLLWEIWEGSESYIDTIFHSSITEAAVAEWKNKRRPPAGEPFFSLYTTDKPGRLEITCNVLPTVMDRVLNSYIVIDFRNGYWATLDCDVTKLPSGYRIRINGSVVTSINLN